MLTSCMLLKDKDYNINLTQQDFRERARFCFMLSQ